MRGGVTDGAFQIGVFQHIPVFADFNFAPSAKFGEKAQDRSVIPAVRFALKLFLQAFYGGAYPAATVALNKGQHFRFRFRERRQAIIERTLLGETHILADVVFRIGDVPQHTQVGIHTGDELLKSFDNPRLRVFTADIERTAHGEKRSFGQKSLHLL